MQTHPIPTKKGGARQAPSTQSGNVGGQSACSSDLQLNSHRDHERSFHRCADSNNGHSRLLHLLIFLTGSGDSINGANAILREGPIRRSPALRKQLDCQLQAQRAIRQTDTIRHANKSRTCSSSSTQTTRWIQKTRRRRGEWIEQRQTANTRAKAITCCVPSTSSA